VAHEIVGFAGKCPVLADEGVVPADGHAVLIDEPGAQIDECADLAGEHVVQVVDEHVALAVEHVGSVDEHAGLADECVATNGEHAVAQSESAQQEHSHVAFADQKDLVNALVVEEEEVL
jgi:hypothetical protein